MRACTTTTRESVTVANSNAGVRLGAARDRSSRLGRVSIDGNPAAYGDAIAPLYDRFYADDAAHVEAAVAMLAELAGDGPVLEFGVGTGTLALPLSERGLRVVGIDASEAMLAELRAKPGGSRVEAVLGDFSVSHTDEQFALVFAAFNTFFMLESQEQQIRCLQEVAARLKADGVFVVEVFVPDPRRWNDDQAVRAERIDGEQTVILASRHDPVAQRILSRQIVLGTDGTYRMLPEAFRYAWPAELDLMAQVAGLELRHRWEDWSSRPFSRSSRDYVSVYGLA
jgi:SAM-dependent methyltransferase